MTRTAPAPLFVPPSTSDDASSVLDLATACFAARAVHVAADLGLMDHLVDRPEYASVLATALDLHAPSLERLLRALASLDLVEHLADGRFALRPRGQGLCSAGPASVRGSVRLMSLWWGPWQELEHSIRSGEAAAERTWQRPAFDHLAAHPAQLQVFHDGMASLNRRLLPAVVRALALRGTEHVVDVAGGHGTLLAEVLQQHPGITGTLFDRPEVVLGARDALADVAARVRFCGGDVFEGVPEGGDTYLLKWILHDWDDADCVRLLTRIRRAMGEGARLLIVERVLPEQVAARPEHTRGCLSDLRMLAALAGKERTATAYRELLAHAGLRLAEIVQTGVDVDVLVAHPAPWGAA